MVRRGILVALTLLASASPLAAMACDTPVSVCSRPTTGSIALINRGQPAMVLHDAAADPAVLRVADSFAKDLERVSGRAATRLTDPTQAKGSVVAIGVVGSSPIIDGLIATRKIDTREIAGKWEGYRQIVVNNPWPGVSRALVIVGSDRRGAVFGTYDLSEKMGVSPWYWFADVPVKTAKRLHVTAGARTDWPRVKYRGFFINDENPAFGAWTQKKFGGVNAKAYEHIFELNLRLKGNYIWPAMWLPKSFAMDDPANIPLADSMGIVMGTSHHEPMTRAQAEWHRTPEDKTTGGRWDYAKNGENLRRFWRGGIERMVSKGNGGVYENVVTLGMRGDGDEPMTEETATDLLETIVADQRKIIAEVTGKPPEATPQVWALYKEVQDYYDHGMSVPDDVTLLFADDNWGQIRRLPDAARKPLDRPGGFGVYYHFDYVGGPRNYKWLNTKQIGKVWQQMDLAYQRQARALWVVNVGDIKPVEFPLDFFMKMAWNPERMDEKAMAGFTRRWADQTFGRTHGAEIASMMSEYSRLAARRKPELVDADSFALGAIGPKTLDGGEFGRIVEEWKALEARSERLKKQIGPDAMSAYVQLIHHPIIGMTNHYGVYYAAAWNRALAAINDPRANAFADAVEAGFQRDKDQVAAYHALNGGKWDGMMSQQHFGYTTWQQPDENIMPTVKRVPANARPASPPALPAASTDLIQVATAFARRSTDGPVRWSAVTEIGRDGSALIALPQGLPASEIGKGAWVEYDIPVAQAGAVDVSLMLSPTLDTDGADGLRIGLSIDGGPIQVVNNNIIPTPGAAANKEQEDWIEAVIDNAHVVTARFDGVAAGTRRVRVWRIDDNIIIDRVIVRPAAR